MSKTNPQPPYRLQLRVLAALAARGTLADSDRQLLHDLLIHLADGGRTEDFFEIANPSHRPRDPVVDQQIFDVCLAMAPKAAGGEGLRRAKAIRSVAEIHKVDDDKINERLKSPRGKDLYRKFSKVFRGDEQGD